MARHILTKEDRQKGFRNAVQSLQVRYNIGFNQAVQYLLRKEARRTGFDGNWVAARQARLNGF
jgi:hypothetical protein